jgi:orotate phosphoribosyltransferase
MQKADFLGMFKKLDAVRNGHFLLASGLHSDTYVQCARVFESPAMAHKLCKALAERAARLKPDCVIGPAVGGIVIAYEMAGLLKARAIYMERVDKELKLRRGFEVLPGERILVTEDVVTTGGSAKEVVEAVTAIGAKVVGVVSLVNRSGGKADFGVPFHSLLDVNPPVYKPEECPMCAKGMPVEAPGMKGLKLEASAKKSK